MLVGFAFRNISYAVKNIRQLPEVRRAMREYDQSVGERCEYCGRVGDTDVHHIRPCALFPSLAADKSNMIALCRGKNCHQVVGHMGDWKTYNLTVRSTCNAATLKGKE